MCFLLAEDGIEKVIHSKLNGKVHVCSTNPKPRSYFISWDFYLNDMVTDEPSSPGDKDSLSALILGLEANARWE